MELLKKCLHWYIPLLWRGGRPKHFVRHAFSNHVMVLNNVTPFVQLQQSAVLSDGVVVKVLNNVTPIDLLAQSAVLFFNSPTCPP